ncbi:MAG: hypothetical protein JST80_11980 [Bdellovibrionales bacterium]|nr:hypothetical protein [Bdellovibrionales bacterium]
MKNLFAVAFAITQVLSATAQAQLPAASANRPALDQVAPGYQPTVFSSRDQVQKLFDEMPYSFRAPSLFGLNQGSQCYMRAEIWTYDWYRNQNIKAMKAFVFYTHAYKEAYKKIYKKRFDWWFHVTPYVLVRDPQTQTLTELALDATFSDNPLEMKPWTDLFVYTKRQCAEFVPYDQFRCEVEGASDACPRTVIGTEHCYLVRVPANIYQPEDIEAYQAGRKHGFDFEINQVSESLDKAPLNSSKKFWKSRLGFSTK